MYIHKHNVCQHYQMKHQLNFILHLTEMLLHILYFFLKRKEEKSGVMWTRLCPLILKCSILSTVHKLQHTHTHTHTHTACLSQTVSTFYLKKKLFPLLFWYITLHVAMVCAEMVANLYHASGLLNTHMNSIHLQSLMVSEKQMKPEIAVMAKSMLVEVVHKMRER